MEFPGFDNMCGFWLRVLGQMNADQPTNANLLALFACTPDMLFALLLGLDSRLTLYLITFVVCYSSRLCAI